MLKGFMVGVLQVALISAVTLQTGSRTPSDVLGNTEFHALSLNNQVTDASQLFTHKGLKDIFFYHSLLTSIYRNFMKMTQNSDFFFCKSKIILTNV